jgi:hypothetical protein
MPALLPPQQVAQALRLFVPLLRVLPCMLRSLPYVVRTVAPHLRHSAPYMMALRTAVGLYAGLTRWYLAALDGVVTLEERRAVVGVVLALELTGWELWVQVRLALDAPVVVPRRWGSAKRKRSRTRHKRQRRGRER